MSQGQSHRWSLGFLRGESLSARLAPAGHRPADECGQPCRVRHAVLPDEGAEEPGGRGASRLFLISEEAMAWDTIEGERKEMTGKVREHWGKLTDDDLAVINGKREQLIGKLQQRYGWAKDEVERRVN